MIVTLTVLISYIAYAVVHNMFGLGNALTHANVNTIGYNFKISEYISFSSKQVFIGLSPLDVFKSVNVNNHIDKQQLTLQSH